MNGVLAEVADQDDFEIFELLLAHGADINETGLYNNRFTPLSFAAYKGKLKNIQFFLDHGAKFKPAAKNQWNALRNAAHNGHLEVVKFLFEKDLDTQGALVSAAQNGHLAVVKFLLEKHADPKGALASAASKGHLEVMKVLLQHGVDSNELHAALRAAVALGQLDAVQLLIDSGVDVNIRNQDGKTALQCAIEYKDVEIANLLKQAGAVE